MPTKKKSKLSKSRQSLAIDYMPLVRMLARYFVAQRPAWQKAAMLPDLEGEGYLALSKAAQTYDKKKLPYPKAYFARAILNAMCKFMKKATRTPGEKVTLAQAEASRLRTFGSPAGNQPANPRTKSLCTRFLRTDVEKDRKSTTLPEDSVYEESETSKEIGTKSIRCLVKTIHIRLVINPRRLPLTHRLSHPCKLQL